MTAQISATLVKELRDRTGAGMMDCKRALQETNGDMDAAVVLLREKGMAQAAKRADRETTEGKVGYRLADDGSKGTMVAVGCETEPVSGNDEFLAYAKKVLEAVDAKGVGAESELEEERVALSVKLGENIAVVGAARFEAVEGAKIHAYAVVGDGAGEGQQRPSGRAHLALGILRREDPIGLGQHRLVRANDRRAASALDRPRGRTRRDDRGRARDLRELG